MAMAMVWPGDGPGCPIANAGAVGMAWTPGRYAANAGAVVLGLYAWRVYALDIATAPDQMKSPRIAPRAVVIRRLYDRAGRRVARRRGYSEIQWTA